MTSANKQDAESEVKAFWNTYYDSLDPKVAVTNEKITLQAAHSHHKKCSNTPLDAGSFHHISKQLGI